MPRRVGGGGAAPGFVREVTLSQYSREMLHMQSMPNFVADGLYLLCPFLRSVHPLSLSLPSSLFGRMSIQLRGLLLYFRAFPSASHSKRAFEGGAGRWMERVDRPSERSRCIPSDDSSSRSMSANGTAPTLAKGCPTCVECKDENKLRKRGFGSFSAAVASHSRRKGESVIKGSVYGTHGAMIAPSLLG